MGSEGGRNHSGTGYVDTKIIRSREEAERDGIPGKEMKNKFEQILNKDNPFFAEIAKTMELDNFAHVPARFNQVDPEVLFLFYYSACMMAEAGEIFDHAKKAIVKGKPLNKEEIGEELTDVGWYVEACSNVLNIPLTEAAQKKCKELIDRIDGGYYKGNSHGNETD